MSVNRRLGRLEKAKSFARKAPCEECGSGANPEDEHATKVTYELTFEDPTEESENEWCSTCGRQLTYDVWWPEDLELAKLPPPPRE